VLPKMKMHD